MTNLKSSLEDLPNELFADIFKNLDVRHLFRAFANLNNRFNRILHSFNHLQFFLHIHQSNLLKSNEELLCSYVYTLVVDPWINFNLVQFPNLRRLRLDRPVPKVLEQVTPTILPHLEYLSIIYMYNMYELDLLRDRIFSNQFLQLTSVELLEEKTLMSIPHWTESPCLTSLQIELIDFLAYQTILRACSNLIHLKFSISSSSFLNSSSSSFIHLNLQQLILVQRSVDWHDNTDEILRDLFVYVPNLSRLTIDRTIHCQNFEQHFQGYDWLASILADRLSNLRNFRYVLHLSIEQKLLEHFYEKHLFEIERNFLRLHAQQHYRARLKFVRE